MSTPVWHTGHANVSTVLNVSSPLSDTPGTRQKPLLLSLFASTGTNELSFANQEAGRPACHSGRLMCTKVTGDFLFFTPCLDGSIKQTAVVRGFVVSDF